MSDALLSWHNDPLLLDQQPVSAQSWTTANDLVTQGAQDRVFLTRNCFNLYGILVKKSDFVRRGRNDRLFARMPYVLLEEELQQILRQRRAEVTQKLLYYLDNIYPTSFDYLKRILSRYENHKRLPLLILRVMAELFGKPQERLGEWLRAAKWESFKHKQFSIPSRNSPMFAYFLGVCNGDGSLSRTHIAIGDKYRDYVERLRRLVRRLFDQEVTITETGKIFILFIKSKWITRLVMFLTDQPLGMKYHKLKEPLLLKETDLAKCYWRGLFDADGSFGQSIQFSSKSPKLVDDLATFLSTHNIAYGMESSTSLTRLHVKTRSWLAFAKAVGVWHPERTKQFIEKLRKGTNITLFKGVNPKKLIDGRYFNLKLIPKLQVKLSGKKVFVKELIATHGTCVYERLLTAKTEFTYPYSSQTVQLPLTPSEKTIRIIQYVTPIRDGISVTLGKHQGLPPRTLAEIVSDVSRLFEITSLQKANGGYKAQHKLLRDFMKTFFIYETPWEPISEVEAEQFQRSWALL